MMNANAAKSDAIFKPTTFDGKVAVGSFSQPVTFVASAGKDHRLCVEPLDVTSTAFCALSDAMGKPGRSADPITLLGESREGIVFSSDHMTLGARRTGTDGHTVQLRTGQATVTLPRDNPAQEAACGVKFSLRGFKSFRPRPVTAQLGQVVVQGAHKVTSKDDVSGAIIIHSADVTPGEGWHADADALADFIWRGLQFAHGGRLHVPVAQEFHPDKVIATFYNGSGRAAHLPAIHFLDQSDFIAALVARFESDTPFPDAVWQAVGWLNSDTSIHEIRYLTLMTAIETILHTLVPNAASTLIQKPKFKPIREALLQTLGDFDLSAEEEAVLAGNIKGINRAPISQKLKAVIQKYGLSPDLFDDDMIRRLNKQRNAITHQGKALGGDSLWECILHAREMIALIVFAELHYTGRYQSYAEGYQQRVIP